MTMNYDLSRTESTSAFTRTTLLVLIPTGTAAPLTREVRDILDKIGASDIASLPNQLQASDYRTLRLVNITSTDDGDTVGEMEWELLPVAGEDNAGIIETATQHELSDGTSDSVAITPRKLETFLGNKLPPEPAVGTRGYYLIQNSGAEEYQLVRVTPAQDGNDGEKGDKGDPGDTGWTPVFGVVARGNDRVLQLMHYVGGSGTSPRINLATSYVGPTGLGSLANATNIRGDDGSQGDAGDDGAGAQFAARLYRRTDSSTTIPSAPTNVGGDSNWSTSYTAPTSSAGEEHAWVAIPYRVGTGAYSYLITLQASFATGGGGGTTPAPAHAIYFLFRPAGTRTITAADVTGAPSDSIVHVTTSTVNGTARTFTFDIPKPAGFTSGQRAPFVVIPDNRRFTEWRSDGGTNQRAGTFVAEPGTAITINTVHFRYYAAIDTDHEFLPLGATETDTITLVTDAD